jgi:hypothetical protein
VLDEQETAHRLRLSLAAQGGSMQTIDIRANGVRGGVTAEGGDLQMHGPDLGTLRVQFPPGDGYVEKDVTLTWK